MNKPKLKTCRVCKLKFEPAKPLQCVCGFECSILHANALAEKNNASISRKYRQDLAIRKEKLKSRQEHLKDAQRFFNIYIRTRDQHLGCCSCDKPASWHGQWHASHYRSVGACPALRFNELNVWKSCSVCNNFLSSNALEYRIRLVAKIGLKQVEWLEGNHEPNHYSIEDIKAIKVKYKQLTKELNAK